jgi:adenylosuccinate synthase
VAITKLDALTGIDPVGVAVRYLGPDGVSFDEFPYHQSVLHKARVELVQLPGWHEPITQARRLEDLPAEARAYLDFVSERLGVPTVLVGVGPRRDQVITTGAGPDLLPPEPAATQAS